MNEIESWRMKMKNISVRSGKMDAVNTKLIAAGILFLFTIISGVIVSHSGRPLNSVLVTMHKLIAIGTVVLIGIALNQMYKTVNGKEFIELSLTIITAVLFLALIATGALLTREEMQFPKVVLIIHQVAPLLTLISSAVTVYLLVKGNS
jgi:hypothetical protein